MNWAAFSPGSALVGGVLIGLATGLTLLLNGKIAGLSGVVARVLRPSGDVPWRVWFLIGIVAGGALTFQALPSAAVVDFSRAGGLGTLAIAGVLVGFGTRLGGGCTSGHGVCGISRGSSGGLAGTLTFMATAGLVVFARGQLFGGSL
ncbi:MAG: YeeE/YedE family protein [Planctomycetes bacterium]|nr:YeeE/YedE family protein [Planctomycetota bacterium]